eukprot:209559_1
MASSLQYKDPTYINNLTNTYKNNSSIVTTIQNELMAAYPFNKSLDRSKSRTLQSYTLTMARENIQNLGSSPSQNVTDIYNRTGQTLNDLNPHKINPDLTHLNQHNASFGPLAYYSMHKHLSLKQHDLYRGNVTDINDIITAQRTVYQFCQSIITNAVVHILLTTPLNLFMPNSSIKEDEMNDMYNKSTDYVPNSYIYNILRNCNSFNIACGKCKTIEIIWDYKNNSAEMNVCAAINVPTSVITNNQRGWVLINGIHSSKTITNSWTSSYILMNGKIHVDGYITKNDGYKVGQKMIKNDFNEILPKIFIENDNHENIENFDIKYDTDYDKYYALLFNINEPTKVEQKVDNALDLDGLNAEIRKNLQVKVLFEEEIQLQYNNIQSDACEYKVNKNKEKFKSVKALENNDDDVILFGSLLKIIDHINVTKHEQLNINDVFVCFKMNDIDLHCFQPEPKGSKLDFILLLKETCDIKMRDAILIWNHLCETDDQLMLTAIKEHQILSQTTLTYNNIVSTIVGESLELQSDWEFDDTTPLPSNIIQPKLNKYLDLIENRFGIQSLQSIIHKCNNETRAQQLVLQKLRTLIIKSKINREDFVKLLKELNIKIGTSNRLWKYLIDDGIGHYQWSNGRINSTKDVIAKIEQQKMFERVVSQKIVEDFCNHIFIRPIVSIIVDYLHDYLLVRSEIDIGSVPKLDNNISNVLCWVFVADNLSQGEVCKIFTGLIPSERFDLQDLLQTKRNYVMQIDCMVDYTIEIYLHLNDLTLDIRVRNEKNVYIHNCDFICVEKGTYKAVVIIERSMNMNLFVYNITPWSRMISDEYDDKKTKYSVKTGKNGKKWLKVQVCKKLVQQILPRKIRKKKMDKGFVNLFEYMQKRLFSQTVSTYSTENILITDYGFTRATKSMYVVEIKSENECKYYLKSADQIEDEYGEFMIPASLKQYILDKTTGKEIVEKLKCSGNRIKLIDTINWKKIDKIGTKPKTKRRKTFNFTEKSLIDQLIETKDIRIEAIGDVDEYGNRYHKWVWVHQILYDNNPYNIAMELNSKCDIVKALYLSIYDQQKLIDIESEFNTMDRIWIKSDKQSI